MRDCEWYCRKELNWLNKDANMLEVKLLFVDVGNISFFPSISKMTHAMGIYRQSFSLLNQFVGALGILSLIFLDFSS